MSSLSLSNAVTAYIQSMIQAGKAQATITVYRKDLLILTRLLNKNHRLLFIDNVSQEMLETAISDPEWINRSDGEMASQSTQARRFTAVSGFFDWAYKVGLTKENPISFIEKPKRLDRLAPYILNDSEVTRLREILKKHTRWIDCRDRVIIECFLSIGLQLHNVIKLKIDDFDFSTNRVRIGKTEKYLNREIRSALADYLPKRHVQNVKNIHALFISQIGTKLSSRGISNRVEYWLNCAGISSGVSAKNLRSTFAVRLYSVRPNLRLLQEALDYKNIATSVIYAVLMDGELESAMEEI